MGTSHVRTHATTPLHTPPHNNSQGLQVIHTLRQHGGMARQVVDVAAFLGEWHTAAQW